MRHPMRALVSSGFLLGASFLCPDGASAQAPTANEIVTRMMERNAQRQAILQHYASDRTYKLEYNGTTGEHHAEMVVHAEYTAPGRKHFTVISQSGSKPLCAEVLRKLVEGEEETASQQDWQKAMFSPETYHLQLLGTEQLDGISTWVLHVEPKMATKVAYRGKVWISMDDYATVRVLAEPAKSPSWLLDRSSFDSWYMRRGDLWVPAKNTSTTHVRIGGEATVTIDYGQYPVLVAAPVSAAIDPPAESVPLQRDLSVGTVVPKKRLTSSLR
jgi:hypothetical protein